MTKQVILAAERIITLPHTDRARLPEILHSPARRRAIATEQSSPSQAQKMIRGKVSPERHEKKPAFDASPIHAEETTRRRRMQDVSMTLSATSRSADPGAAVSCLYVACHIQQRPVACSSYRNMHTRSQTDLC